MVDPEKAIKAGISNEKVAVIATCDRSGNKDFEVVTTGRISKKDLNKVYQGTLDKVTVLCSDSHRSYGAFAKSSTIIHKKFNASKGQKTVASIALASNQVWIQFKEIAINNMLFTT